jgi:hypothetical protein
MVTKEARNKFNYLSLEDKASLLSGYAHHLECMDTPDGKYFINIYELNAVYIEVFYNTRTKTIDQIWMPSYDELDCYLKQISIRSLGIKM